MIPVLSSDEDAVVCLLPMDRRLEVLVCRLFAATIYGTYGIRLVPSLRSLYGELLGAVLVEERKRNTHDAVIVGWDAFGKRHLYRIVVVIMRVLDASIIAFIIAFEPSSQPLVLL